MYVDVEILAANIVIRFSITHNVQPDSPFYSKEKKMYRQRTEAMNIERA